MAKEDLVASLKNKQKVTIENNDEMQQELFVMKDAEYNKTFDKFSINFKHSDVEDYLKSLNVSIHLVVTSPPYNCNIKYDVHEDNMDWNEYESWLTKVFELTNNKMVEGGRIILNFPIFVKSASGRKSLIPIFEKIISNAGFEIFDYIDWIKAKDEKEAIGVAGRSTAWGSWLSPSSPNVRPISELIMVAKKPGKFISINDEVTISTEEFKASTISAWFIQGSSSKYHPATFPPEIACRAINLYSYKYDNIFDPFMGIGSTAVACLTTNRSFYGCDISKKYIQRAAARISGV
jgi:site-specific DNA-methyltransferase (adenine-specific)